MSATDDIVSIGSGYLQELRESVVRLDATANGYAQQASALRRERDEARAARDELQSAFDLTKAVAERAGMERNEARAARDSLAEDLAAARADAEVARAAVARAVQGERDANLEVGNQMAIRDEARKERDAALSQVAALREALSMHVEVYGEPFHDDPAGSCDFDRQGGQRDCPRCVVNAMSAAALADTEKAAREHDAKVAQAERDKMTATIAIVLGYESMPVEKVHETVKRYVAEHDARVRATALEEAAEAGAFRVTDYDNVGVELEIIADRVRRAIQDIAATPSAAPAPERAKCAACGGEGDVMEDHDGRLGYGTCRDCGGTGETHDSKGGGK